MDQDAKRAAIQAELDEGDVDLFGMTYHPTYGSLTGYVNWIVRPGRQPGHDRVRCDAWLTNPVDYLRVMRLRLTLRTRQLTPLIDSLRAEYPDTTIFAIPYGLSAVSSHPIRRRRTDDVTERRLEWRRLPR